MKTPSPICFAKLKEEVVFEHLCNDGDDCPPGFKIVYIILASESQKLKIGITENLDERFRQLQAMSPEKIEVLMSFYSIGYEFENYLHRKLKKYRLHGEWFALNDEVAEVIDSLNARRDSEELKLEKKRKTVKL